jgi:hypothetical protein
MSEKKSTAELLADLQNDPERAGRLACAYGAHDFVLLEEPMQPAWAKRDPNLHMHKCSRCDATYFSKGKGPCYACRKPDKEQETADD